MAMAVDEIRSVLVPLDGSRLAEVAVPVAVEIASRLGARVTLLHVLEHDAPESVHGERHLRTVDEASRYLASIVATIPPGVRGETHVHENPEHDVAQSLVDHMREFRGELVVLAAHGRGGLRGFLFGRIAQQVVRKGAEPVLMLQEFATEGPAFSCRRIAVLLDGSEEAERALPPAVALARGFRARLHLIRAVPTARTLTPERSASATLVPGTARALLELEEDDADGYLMALVERLQRAGLDASWAVVRGDPAMETVAEAERAQADVVAFASHGGAGVSGAWSGSIGAKIAGRTRKPLLLVPAEHVPSDAQ